MIIWWREFDDEPARGNSYRIESYTRLIKKENETGTHTHIIEWLLSREAAPEKFIPFLLLDWEIVGRVSWAPIYFVATSLWKQERETDNRKSFRSTPKTLNWGQKKERHKNEVIISVDLSGTIGQDSRLASRMEPLDQYEGNYSYRLYDTVLNNIAFIT